MTMHSANAKKPADAGFEAACSDWLEIAMALLRSGLVNRWQSGAVQNARRGLCVLQSNRPPLPVWADQAAGHDRL